MKNYEKYDKEIKEILDEGFDIAVIKGKVKKCSESDCFDCAFDFGNSDDSCKLGFYNWLFEEYIEPPKLTKRQRAFCEAFPDMWLADSISSGAVLYSEKPEISSTDMFRLYIPHECTIMIIPEKIISFPFMKPFTESGELYNTSEMLKWEVEEEKEENHSEEAILYKCSNCGMLSTKKLEYCSHCKGKMVQTKKRK